MFSLGVRFNIFRSHYFLDFYYFYFCNLAKKEQFSGMVLKNVLTLQNIAKLLPGFSSDTPY